MAEPYAPSKAEKEAFYDSWDWKRLAFRVLNFYGRKCLCCGKTPAHEPIVVDHILPLSTHWDLRLSWDNLQPLCYSCNKGKSNLDTTDFRPPVTPVTDSGPYLPMPQKPIRRNNSQRIDRTAGVSDLGLYKPYFVMTAKIAYQLRLASWTREQLKLAGLSPEKKKGWIKKMIGRMYPTEKFEAAYIAE